MNCFRLCLKLRPSKFQKRRESKKLIGSVRLRIAYISGWIQMKIAFSLNTHMLSISRRRVKHLPFVSIRTPLTQSWFCYQSKIATVKEEKLSDFLLDYQICFHIEKISMTISMESFRWLEALVLIYTSCTKQRMKQKLTTKIRNSRYHI